MNNDTSPSSSPVLQHASSFESGVETDPADDASSDRQSRQSQLRRIYTRKRGELLDHLLRSLDLVIYCEIASVYYLDCQFFPFILRSLIQFYFLTPKPPYVPPIPKPPPYIGALFGTNILCLLLHVFSARPEASEATRGYLHGSLIIDFVGQQGPTSKLRLIMLDALIVLLQLAMLAAHVERQDLGATLAQQGTGLSAGTAAADERRDVVPSLRDHDAEERGMLGSEAGFAEDIELRSLRAGQEDNGEVAFTAEDRIAEGEAGENVMDLFNSAQVVSINLHLLDTIRSQWWAFESRRHSSNASSNGIRGLWRRHRLGSRSNGRSSSD